MAREETERVDTLRYSWHNLQRQVRETTVTLAELEARFRRQLIDDVTAFTDECNRFYTQYDTVAAVATTVNNFSANIDCYTDSHHYHRHQLVLTCCCVTALPRLTQNNRKVRFDVNLLSRAAS